MCRLFLAVAAAIVLSAAHAGEPGFDCHQAETWADKTVCAGGTLQDLQRAIDRRYATLEKQLTGPLASSMRVDEHAWLKEREECRKASEPQTPEQCLQQSIVDRLSTLDYYMRTLVGPRRPAPVPKISCGVRPNSEPESSECLVRKLTEAQAALVLVTRAAELEMTRLEVGKTAETGTEQSFARASIAFRVYREANCVARAAALANGSARPAERIACQIEMTRERTKEVLRVLPRLPVYWSETVSAALGGIEGCKQKIQSDGDKNRIRVVKITDVEKEDLLTVRLLIDDEQRIDCLTGKRPGTVREVTPLNGRDVEPDEGLTIFTPDPSPPRRDDACLTHERAMDDTGKPIGWFSYSDC